MGYSSRYHAASLAAIFVALAIGILIGAALGADVISGTAESLEDDLGEDLDRLRAENADLRDEADFQSSLSDQLYPAVVDSRLTGQRIALIGLGEVDTAGLRDDAQTMLENTGAELVEVARLREPPDSDRLIDGLVGPRASAMGRDEALRLAARRAGRLIVGRGSGPDNALNILLSSFSGDATGIRGVLLAQGPRGEWSMREERDVEILEEGLIQGMTGEGVRVVGVEREDDEDTSIAFFEDLGIPSVDDIDRIAGKVAAVLALDGADGSFGTKDSADTLLPELIDPPTTDAQE
jgi:hypothetical protein